MNDSPEQVILDIAAVKLKTDLPVKKSPLQFKEFILNNFPQEPIIGFLDPDTEDRPLYPLVQIKILQGTPVIIGINEGIEPARAIKDDFDRMDFGNITFKVLRVEEEEYSYQLEVLDSQIFYQFLTPWVALNDDDSMRFRYYYENERHAFLNRLLNKNLVFFAKEFSFSLGKDVMTSLKVKSLNPMPVNGSPHGGFWGGFYCNLVLPNLIGIGNGISRGYGTIYSQKLKEMMGNEENEDNSL